MNNNPDWHWLANQAQDDQSRQWLIKIRQWRQPVLKSNEFIKGERLFALNLQGGQLWFREDSAFSAIEVYLEIFKENNHFLAPGFSGKKAKVVVDIGANQGFYSLKIANNNPQCHLFCVEPNPYLFEILKRNVQTNHLKKAVLINKAIGQHQGKIELEIVKEIGAIGGKDLGIVNRPWLKKDFIKKITVKAITLAELCRENNLQAIDILKIDTEGMEMDILQGGRRVLPKVRKIVVEYHRPDLKNEIISFLKKQHFRLVFQEAAKSKYYADLYFINGKTVPNGNE